MKRVIALWPLTLLVGAMPTRPMTPQWIMSMDLCDDLLLLMIGPKKRIASLTFLAHDAANQLMPGADKGVASNKPDLIIGSVWSTATARKLAKQVGAPLVETESSSYFAGIRRTVRRIGQLVKEPERAEALMRQMDADLMNLASRRPAHLTRVVAWDPPVRSRARAADRRHHLRRWRRERRRQIQGQTLFQLREALDRLPSGPARW